MRPISLSTHDASGASKASSVAVVDTYQDPFNIGFGCVVTGTVNYTVQHTFDNPLAPDFTPATATWFNHSTVASASASTDGNYAFPVQGIRLLQNSGSGSVHMTLVQAGMPGR